MNTKIIKVNVCRILFYIAYFLLVAQSMTRWVLNIDFFQSFCNNVIPILLILILILHFKKYTYNNVLMMLVVVFISFISYLVAKDRVIFNLVLFLFAAKDIDFKKLIKFDLIIKSAIMLLIFFLYHNNMTEKVIYLYNIRGVRYALGFGHPNTLSIYVLSICSDIAYLNYGKKNLKLYLLFAIIALIINEVCRSRGPVICIFLLIILSIILPKLKNNGVAKKLMTWLFPILMICSYVSAIFFLNYNSEVLVRLNELFSSRINLMANFIQKYPLNLFGNLFLNYATGTAGTDYVLDNAYMSLLIKFGILVAILFIIAIPKLIKKLESKDDYAIIMCLIVYMFLGLMENAFYVLFYNPFLLSLSFLIYKNIESSGDKIENK